MLPGPVLITGATGKLGRPTATALRAAGHDVRELSRRPGADRVVADLLTGHGLQAALDGVHTVVNLATSQSTDVTMGRNLLAAAETAGVQHLIQVSIVGVDRLPLPYYRAKFELERLVEAGRTPYTIVRSTQFHNLVAGVFAAQRFSPVLLSPAFDLQPIDVRDVSERLVSLTAEGASGRVPDIGGPERRTGRGLADAWRRATGSRKPVVVLRLPGKAFAAYAAGHHLVPGEPYGSITFEAYLASEARRTHAAG